MRGCAFRPASHYPGSHFNQGKNGVWLSVDWVNTPHPESEIRALADGLAQHQIHYVFAYVSYVKTSSAEFNPSYPYAAEFVAAFKKAQPTLELLAWVGLPMPSLGGAADLSDPAIRQKIASFSADLVRNDGFDGVQLDPEIVASGDQHVIALLDETRQAIGSHALLSIAAEKIQPIFPDLSLAGRSIGWSSAYYRQIAAHVDQLAVMTYDTSLQNDGLYRELLRFEVIDISQALKGTNTSLLFGVPASEEITATHDPAVENVDNGVQGIIDGLNDFDSSPDNVSGIAIYPAWEMTATKWATYESKWLGR